MTQGSVQEQCSRGSTEHTNPSDSGLGVLEKQTASFRVQSRDGGAPERALQTSTWHVGMELQVPKSLTGPWIGFWLSLWVKWDVTGELWVEEKHNHRLSEKCWGKNTEGWGRKKRGEFEGYWSPSSEKWWQSDQRIRSGGEPFNADNLEFTSYILIIAKGKLCCRGIMKSILSPIK